MKNRSNTLTVRSQSVQMVQLIISVSFPIIASLLANARLKYVLPPLWLFSLTSFVKLCWFPLMEYFQFLWEAGLNQIRESNSVLYLTSLQIYLCRNCTIGVGGYVVPIHLCILFHSDSRYCFVDLVRTGELDEKTLRSYFLTLSYLRPLKLLLNAILIGKIWWEF